MSIENGGELPGCSVAIKCANDPMIERCLASIDDDVSVHVTITPSDAVEGLLRDRGIPYDITEYGNIAKSCDIGVREAEHDNIIIMDSDTWFLPGSIRKLREALRVDMIAKGSMQFLSDTAMSSTIAIRRNDFYSRPDYPSCPGLAFRRTDLAAACGGYVFNPKVRWTEDADLNFRVKRAGIDVRYVPEAVLMHGPVTFNHEIKAAFLYGIGKRLSVEQTPDRDPTEEFPDIMIAGLKGLRPSNVFKNLTERGLGVSAFDRLWRSIYLAGYHSQKISGHWSVESE